MCAVMLDTKGPEIRTGKLKNGKPIQLVSGQQITITTDYDHEGDDQMIAMSYKKLAVDVGPGSSILCADGSIVLEVVSTDPASGTVRCVCKNTATLGERKNVNLPGVVVDLPTLTAKDEEDLLNWGVPNEIDLIAASFVRKASDIDYIRGVLGEKGRYIKIISKVENQEGIQNFDEILRATDGVMVSFFLRVFSRGNLGLVWGFFWGAAFFAGARALTLLRRRRQQQNETKQNRWRAATWAWRSPRRRSSWRRR
jgi:pyruvate kinase